LKKRYITAIGGSAGALDPLKIFFDHTPNDQVTYVVVRHLSPTYKSVLKKILDKHSRLEIIEVEDGMLLENNKVYLPPSDKYMVLEQGVFHLLERQEGPNRAIDTFMKSVAWNIGDRSIAVILSGAGSDGVKGAEFVKNAGGLVIAQLPESCEHASMPAHAIKSGNVDYVVLPSQMPRIILDHVQSHRD